MTREEARKVLNRLSVNYIGLKIEEANRIDKALSMAISALTPPTQEQMERVWGAEWVKKHRHRGGFRRYTGTDDMGEVHTITVDERMEYDDLYCSKCGKQSADNFLNFCPNCGSAMTQEAWKELRKRWEALYASIE